MNMLVGALVFVPLLTMAFAHFLWSFGYTWPIRDEVLLAQSIVGTPGTSAMPSRLLLFGVGLFTLAGGVVALSLADHDSGGLLMTELGGILAVVFLARGIIGYTPTWRARHPGEPFTRLDRRTYSPACLWIGIGFLLLIAMRLM